MVDPVAQFDPASSALSLKFLAVLPAGTTREAGSGVHRLSIDAFTDARVIAGPASPEPVNTTTAAKHAKTARIRPLIMSSHEEREARTDDGSAHRRKDTTRHRCRAHQTPVTIGQLSRCPRAIAAQEAEDRAKYRRAGTDGTKQSSSHRYSGPLQLQTAVRRGFGNCVLTTGRSLEGTGEPRCYPGSVRGRDETRSGIPVVPPPANRLCRG